MLCFVPAGHRPCRVLVWATGVCGLLVLCVLLPHANSCRTPARFPAPGVPSCSVTGGPAGCGRLLPCCTADVWPLGWPADTCFRGGRADEVLGKGFCPWQYPEIHASDS
jgi:hypothetical protein